jgi:hypothetical protein
VVVGEGSGDSASDPLVDVGAGVDFPPLGGDVFGGEVLGGEVLGDEVLAGDDVVALGAGPFEVGEFGLGVLVDVVLEVVDGAGVPDGAASVVDVVAGVGTVLLVGEPVPDGVAPGWVVFGPLAVGTAAVGAPVGAPGAVASTPTQ